MSEFERLERTVIAAGGTMTLPPLMALCVVGRGLWVHGNDGEAGKWWHCPATANHNEVLTLIGTLMNSLPDLRRKRRNAKLGSYIVDMSDFVAC